MKNMGTSKGQVGLEFLDLESFNKALLAKQCWRILQNPDSLAAKILKAKYFKRGTILTAQLERWSSFVWLSIWSARDLLQACIICWVGNGGHIWIWKNKRIPQTTIQPLLALRWGVGEEALVADLIDWKVRGWKTSQVCELFGRVIAHVICQLLIGSINNNDRPIWSPTAHGDFAVRSVYHLHKKILTTNEGECSRSGQHSALWKTLKTEYPPSCEGIHVASM